MKAPFSRQWAISALLALLASSSSRAATNAWTSLVTGNWHDLTWSLGSLPNSTQDLIAITNHGSKGVIIGAATAENHPSSLQIQNLAISSPEGWTNTVLLNYLAHRDPLSISETAFVGSGGVLMNLFSKLQLPGASGELKMDGGSFVQEGGSTVIANKLFVGWSLPGTVALTNATLTASNIVIGVTNTGLFIQSGGSVISDFLDLGYSTAAYHLESGDLQARYLRLGERISWEFSGGSGAFQHRGGTSVIDEVRIGQSGASGSYHLSGGVANIRSLTVSQSGPADFRITGGRANIGGITVSNNERESGYVTLDAGELKVGFATIGYSGWGYFRHNGGTLDIESLTISGDSYRWAGSYHKTNGVLNAGQISLTRGVMSQSDGTIFITNGLSVGELGSGFYLSGGRLVSARCGVAGWTSDQRAVFFQDGGIHEINGALDIGGRYTLSGGTLSARSISLSREAELNLSGGQLSSIPAVNLSGGTLTTTFPDLQLGTLELGEYTGFSRRPAIAFPTTDSAIRFGDSHLLPWHPETTLWIFGWKGNLGGGGNHRLYIGSGQSLSEYQLSRIRFENPPGLPAGNYFAQQLPTGEIVPGQRWYIEFRTREEELSFRWDAPWILEFSTTPQGPYQPLPLGEFTYSYNTPYSGRSGFFRLRKGP